MKEQDKELVPSYLSMDFLDTKKILDIRANHPHMPIYAVIAKSDSIGSHFLDHITTDKGYAQKNKWRIDIDSFYLVSAKLQSCANGFFVFEQDDDPSCRYVFKQAGSVGYKQIK